MCFVLTAFHQDWREDSSLEVLTCPLPAPTEVLVAAAGPAAAKYQGCLGIYTREQGTGHVEGQVKYLEQGIIYKGAGSVPEQGTQQKRGSCST